MSEGIELAQEILSRAKHEIQDLYTGQPVEGHIADVRLILNRHTQAMIEILAALERLDRDVAALQANERRYRDR